MKDTLTNKMRGLAEIRNRSSSNEEFWLRAAAEGALPGFWATALFRLCLLRNEHPGLKWLEAGALGFGAVGILLLAVAVLVPLELLLLSFEDLRRSMFGARR